MSRRNRLFIFLPLFLTLLLSACSNPSSTPPQDTSTPTTEVSPTPTAEPERLVYVSASPADSDANVPILTQFAAENALQFEQEAAFDGASLGSTARIVVLTAEPADLSAVLDANPAVQFILLGSSAISGKSTLSVVSAKAEDVYFMAGYLTTLIAYDWRSAGLVVSDSPLGDGAADAFTNGGEYVCGKCNPSYPPMVNLPALATLPAASAPGDWLAQANTLLVDGINAFFLDPQAVVPDVAAALVNSQTVIISTADPLAGTEAWWGATIATDSSAALGEVLTKALNGEGGQQIGVPITLTNVNANLVSPARQDLFNQTAQLLAEGKLAALSIP